jgi:tetratricopeptide (TPR) repeat protein
MKSACRWMSVVCVGVILFAVSGTFVTAAAAAQEQQQKPAYTLAEYNAYTAANNEKDPQTKIKLLDDFVAKYPNSTLLPFAYRAYYLTYYQMKNYVQTLAYVDKLLALGPKIDIGSRMEGQIARAQAYFQASSDKSLQTPEQYTAARTAAQQGLATLAEWQKPTNVTDEQFAQQKKSIGILFNSVAGIASSGLKDYAAAQESYKAALVLDPKDAVTHYRLGVAYLQAMPPNALNGYWELSRSIALKGPGEDQVRAYLRNQILHYQQPGCEKLVDDEMTQLLTLAASSDALPATFVIPSAEDLKKAQEDTGNFMPWLQEGGDHGKIMWLATCGLEYPDVPVRVMEARPEGDGVTLSVYRPVAVDPDAAQKEMEAATVANMEVHVVGQPEASRVQKDDYVRFTGTLSKYQQMPFLLTWDMAKINPEDIPAEKAAPGAKRPARKLPGAK